MITRKVLFPLLILLCIAFTVFLFQPGYIDNDSKNQLEQIRSGHFDDWHPPAMSWVWGHFNRIVPGPFGMFLLQVVLFWAGLGIVVNMIASSQTGRSLYLLIGFYPPAFMMLGTVIKDVLMGTVLLFGFSLILYSERRKSIVSFVFGMLFLGYGMLIRHNAIPAVLPLCLYAGFVFTSLNPTMTGRISPVWRGIITGSAFFILVFAVGRAWNNHLTDTKTYPFQQIMLHDLVGISIRTKTYLVPDYLASAEQPSMKDLRRIYQLRSMKNLYWPDFTNIHFKILLDPGQVRDLVSTWGREVVDHPKAYLMHRSDVFTGVLNLKAARTCAPYYYEETTYKPKGFYQNGSVNDYYSNNPITNRLFMLAEPLRESLIYWNWLYVLLPLILFTVSLHFVLGPRTSDIRFPSIALALSASGWLYGLAYFFVATACDFRMVYWNVLTALPACMFLLNSIGRKNSPL